MLRTFRCDLHIHTCLSPCAELDMYPTAIVERAAQRALDVIAVCDHNSSENVAYVRKCAALRRLIVLAGMEITSREEVHLLALFDDLFQLEALQELIYTHLPGTNDETAFGCQVIVNDADEVEGFNEHLLIGAVDLGLADLIAAVHSRGGLAIAAHIDRPSFSVLSQLGFIGPDMPFDALEVTWRLGMRKARERYPELSSYAMVESSDAHFLEDIGRTATCISLERPTTEELKLAFAHSGGREVQI